jgi:hypothetical protein
MRNKLTVGFEGSSFHTGSNAGGALRACQASTQPSTTRGRPLELNPRHTAAPWGCCRASPPAPRRPSDGSVASDPHEAIMAGTYGRMKGSRPHLKRT